MYRFFIASLILFVGSLTVKSQSAYQLSKTADSLRLIGDFSKAVECYTKSIALESTGYRLIWRGYCYRNVKAYQKAIDDFQTCVSQNQSDNKKLSALYEQLGLTYDAMKDYYSAINYYNKANDLGLYLKENYQYLALDYFFLKNYSKAAECIDLAINSAKSEKTGNESIGQLYKIKAQFLIKMGLYNDAIQEYQNAYELTSSASYDYYKGKVYLLYLNKSEEAKPFFQKAYASKGFFSNASCIFAGERACERDFSASTYGDPYEKACIYSLLGNEQKSIDILDMILTKHIRTNGLNDRNSIFKILFDDELMYIRSKPSFQKLMDKYGISYQPSQENLEVAIRNNIRTELSIWEEKGEFETSQQYLARISKRDAKVAELTNKNIEAYKNVYSDGVGWHLFTIEKYDSDSQSFKIINSVSGDVAVVVVPIEEAPNFKENKSKLVFLNQDFILQNNKWVLSSVDIKNPVNGKVYRYDITKQASYDPSSKFILNYDDVKIDIPNQNIAANQNTSTNSTKKIIVGKSDVDTNIPVSSTQKNSTYCFIVGNEDYSSYQNDLSTEVNVDFAANDAKVFKEYCNKTLGVPEKQIKLLINGTVGQINQGIAWLANLAKVDNGNAELIFYYSGHGLPDEQTKEAYLIPVDISGNNVSQGIKLNDLYAKLNEYPSKKVTVFLDACFSGGARNQGLIAMKGVKVRPKENLVNGNMVVFSSSTGEESSGVYREMQHGYMTYFLLKKLQETKGEVNYKDFAEFIIQSVKKETALNGKIQTPQLNFSPAVENVWVNWLLK